MPEPLRIGLIREGKNPPDSRAALTPEQAGALSSDPRFALTIQPSPGRCYPDAAYTVQGVALDEDITDCEVLLGVKEVPIAQLIAGKTYFFFSHTHKQQPYNRELLQAVLEKNVRLIDYELLTDEAGQRLIAFGKFAGMVGAHHALRAWGLRTGSYELPQMSTLQDYEAAKAAYAKTDFGAVRIVVTGTGRVGNGAAEVLRDAGLAEVTHEAFLSGRGPQAAYTQLGVKAYVRKADGGPFEKKHFFTDPASFETSFIRWAHAADVLVHGIFWDNRAPAMFALEDMRTPGWRIQVISDVTCDIAPVSSIPATLRASTIADPYFGFDPTTGNEVDAWNKDAVSMVTVDNLPNEMPRAATQAFGSMFSELILPELLTPASPLLARATIAQDGALTERYRYLTDYVKAA